MVYTLTLNPALDYLMNVPDLQTGELNRSESERIFPGGKGINVSIMLSHLGVSNVALGFLAGKTGFMFADMLQDLSIASDFIFTDEGQTRINVKIKSASETEINSNGPIIGEAQIKALHQKLDLLNKDDVLILAGNVPKSIPQSIYREIVEKMSQKGVICIVDATGQCLTSVLPHGPFLVKPNHHELGEIFHTEITNLNQAAEYGQRLREMGAKNVLVSMAEAGAVLVTEDGQAISASAPQGRVLNSVGAGDSMVAGFVAGYLGAGDYEEALKLAVSAGSATAFSEMIADEEKVLQIKAKICNLQKLSLK